MSSAPAHQSSSGANARGVPLVATGPAKVAALAQQLFAVLSDGAPALPFSIRGGFALRDLETRLPIRSSFTSEWRRAKDVLPDGTERDRLANAAVLARHLIGQYDIAIAAPSWSS